MALTNFSVKLCENFTFWPIPIIQVAAEDNDICTKPHTTGLEAISIWNAKLKNNYKREYKNDCRKNATTHTLSNSKLWLFIWKSKTHATKHCFRTHSTTIIWLPSVSTKSKQLECNILPNHYIQCKYIPTQDSGLGI